MMATERASIFGDDDLDVSGFMPAPTRRPTQTIDRQAIRKVAESRGFESREPEKWPEKGNEPDAMRARPQRRHTTGRNKQLNIKATDDAIARFYAIADARGWVLGEAFEHAINALEKQRSVEE